MKCFHFERLNALQFPITYKPLRYSHLAETYLISVGYHQEVYLSLFKLITLFTGYNNEIPPLNSGA